MTGRADAGPRGYHDSTLAGWAEHGGQREAMRLLS